MSTPADVVAGRAAWSVACSDALTGLRALPDESVHCAITSPPYFGLRAYLPNGHPDKALELGLEPDLSTYLARLVAVFAEVRRVLRRDGTCWVVMGDSYATNPGNGRGGEAMAGGHHSVTGAPPHRSGADKTRVGLPEKNLLGVPWRLAFALQDDGWYLRSAITWCKPSPMPESVTDRPTSATEMLFLLTRSSRYAYDADAIREPNSESTLERHGGAPETRWGEHRSVGTIPSGHPTERHPAAHHVGLMVNGATAIHTTGRNKRNWWVIPSEAFPDAHFATFPCALVEPCILAGCPARVCPACGAPWTRTVQRAADGWKECPKDAGRRAQGLQSARSGLHSQYRVTITTDLGWAPGCTHDLAPIGGLCLDPFAGSGTVGVVALRHGRRFVGFDLSEAYCAMARDRITQDAPLLNTPPPALEPPAPAQLDLFEEAAG